MKFEGESNYVKNIASVTASLNQKCLDALKKVKLDKSDSSDSEDLAPHDDTTLKNASEDPEDAFDDVSEAINEEQ